MTGKISSWRAVWLAMRSWRTASVSLLSFSSGLPLGLVWIAIPTWLARADVDIKIIGLFTLAHARRLAPGSAQPLCGERGCTRRWTSP